jgi:hypothetical protein
MNNYITLDGYKYQTLAENWVPASVRPVSAQMLMSGGIDVVFGPSVMKRWTGIIRVLPTSESGWGGISELRASYAKLQSLSMTDHWGDTYTVTLLGDLEEMSLAAKWDSASNRFLIPTEMVGQ